MERKITITPVATAIPKKIRVAAYARVSLGTEQMLHSLAAQVSYYSNYIQSNSEWQYAGVYADANETGTKENRPEFIRLIEDCRAGLIDKVITKSISRFGRNTVALLETVRELKDLGIGVWFEEQNIDTLTNDGELMLAIIAGFAQEESRSVSENIKWRKRNDMKSGKAKPSKVYGYTAHNDTLIIEPQQAEVVKMIFDYFLEGLGQTTIANKLNEQGIKSPTGCKWLSSTVRRILTNPKMCGNLIFQSSFIADHISKKQKRNKGELPMYQLENTHEPIISVEVFNAVQAELKRRNNFGSLYESEGSVFRKKIECANCGRKFCHTSNGKGESKHRAWICGGRDKRIGINCSALSIPEPTLMKVTAEVLGLDEFDGTIFTEQIEKIIAHDNRELTFVFNDGSAVKMHWQKRKPVPYSIIGSDKRVGRNICYSIIGKGNGKRKKKEVCEGGKD